MNARGMNDETALLSAARRGRTDVVFKLLASGADPAIVNIYGETAVDVVQERLLDLESRSAMPARSRENDLESQKREFRKIQELLQGALR